MTPPKAAFTIARRLTRSLSAPGITPGRCSSRSQARSSCRCTLATGASRADSPPQMPGAEIVTADRARTLRLLLRLAQRAKDAGALRADFVLEDLVLLLMANEGIRAPTRRMKAAASRRFTALALESLHTGPPPTNFPPPVRLPLLPEATNPQPHA
jgi:hypothetical protein